MRISQSFSTCDDRSFDLTNRTRPRRKLAAFAGIFDIFARSEKPVILPTHLQKFLQWTDTSDLPSQPVNLKLSTDAGRGLYAKRYLGKGERIVYVPNSLVITAEVAGAQSRLQPLFSAAALPDWTVLAVFLTEVKALGSPAGQQCWDDYVNILPVEVQSVLSWKQEQLSWLLGSPLHSLALEIQNAASASVSEAEPLLREAEQRGLVPDGTFTGDQVLQWAFEILLSRLIRLPNLGTEALVPWADFVNHDPTASCFFDWDSTQRAVVLRADRPYNAGEQVFVSYGQKSSGELLLSYGFAPEDNHWDNFKLAVKLDPSDRFLNAKTAALSGHGFSSCATFPLRLGALPAGLVEYAAVAVAEVESESEVKQLVDELLTGGLTKHQERFRVLGQAATVHLIEQCRAALSRYPTSVDTDQELLASVDQSSLEGTLVRIRLQEKRILHRAIFILQQQRKSWRSA